MAVSGQLAVEWEPGAWTCSPENGTQRTQAWDVTDECLLPASWKGLNIPAGCCLVGWQRDDAA